MPSRALARAALLTLAASLSVAQPGPARAATCPPVSFNPRLNFGTGSGPVEVAVADFTGDGIPDLAVTETDGTIGVLPGLASGGVPTGEFGARIATFVGGVPHGIATADLDSDSRPDLVVGNVGANTVQVLRGLGAGTFAAPLSLPAGLRPYEVLTGDFNEDGVLDIATANNGENSVRVLIGGNDGTGHWNGSFATSVAYVTTNLPLAIASGDFNEDGITDLVATESYSQSVALFLGNGSSGQGDGTFQTANHFADGAEPYDLATGDFNEDGHLDLAVASGNYSGLRVFLGTGTGQFPSNTSYLPGVNCSGVAAGDVDADGITDLLVSSAVDAKLYALRGDGTGAVGNGAFAAPQPFEDCCFAVHVITADLNADGHADAVTCRYQGAGVSVFLQGCVPDPNLPHIVRIRDVPNDQGGNVFITWLRSALDVTGGPVNSYRVWRLVPPEGAAERLALREPSPARTIRHEIRTRPDGVTEVLFWEALATLPAQRSQGYGYTAATPQDSMRGSNPYFTYRISALTSNIDVFYDSDPDSGYSVDNIRPPGASGLHATVGGEGTHLEWDPCDAEDFEKFEIHRSSDPTFTPSAATLVAGTTTAEYVDPSWEGGTYKVAALDKHGNTGEWASVDVAATTAVHGKPGTTWLASPAPNPMRASLDVHYSVAEEGPVSLMLFDQAGRVVRTLQRGVRPAGEAHLRWDARNEAGAPAAAGLYYLELKSGGRRFVARVVLVR